MAAKTKAKAAMTTTHEHVVQSTFQRERTMGDMTLLYVTGGAEDREERVAEFEEKGYAVLPDHPRTRGRTVVMGMPTALKNARYKKAAANVKASINEQINSAATGDLERNTTKQGRSSATIDDLVDRMPDTDPSTYESADEGEEGGDIDEDE